MRFRYLIEKGTNPYRNLAIEQELMKKTSHDMAILYLWQNDNTVVIGRNQDVYNECNVDEFTQGGGRIARRKSGGGAVYHDLGNLNYSILSVASEKITLQYHRIIMRALDIIGIKSEFNGRNDIIIEGRKCSGNAIYQNGEMLCQHGTILVNTDIGRMNSVLTPDKSKLDRNHVSSVSSRVINLNEINSEIDVNTMINAMIVAADAEKMQKSLDIDKISKLMSFYEDKTWIYGGKQ